MGFMFEIDIGAGYNIIFFSYDIREILFQRYIDS